MPSMQKCKQCGEIKTVDQFRMYYNDNAKERYKTCKTCEKINSRYKYLLKKKNGGKLSDLEQEELNNIDELFSVLEEQGLRPPKFGVGRTRSVTAAVSELLNKKREEIKVVEEVKQEHALDDIPAVLPPELIYWLQVDLTELNKEPEYLQDEVYEELRSKYRPQTGIESGTLTPIYDDKYRSVLNKILERFDEYEEQYYNKD